LVTPAHDSEESPTQPRERPKECSMNSVLLRVAVIAVMVAPLLAQAAEVPDFHDLPWDLRDHYEFGDEQLMIMYGVDNGEWSLQSQPLGVLMNLVTASIRLKDGTEIDLNSIGKGTPVRERVTTHIGDGYYYGLQFPDHAGLRVSHTITQQVNHPFHLLRIEVTNISEEPITISEIRSVILHEGDLAKFGTDVDLHRRYLTIRDACVLYDTGKPPLYIVFNNDAAGDLTFSMGIIPMGMADTSVDVQTFDGAWRGGITSSFAPGYRLESGETVSADPVWMTLHIPDPADIDLAFAWAQASLPKPSFNENSAPARWVTVEPGRSLGDLEEAFGRLKGKGVKHALIPDGWQTKLGTYRGASPGYPRSIGAAARSLRDAGATPGLTIDALAADAGKSEGQAWFNPTVDNHQKAIEKIVRGLAADGFGFFVVPPSQISDKALQQMNLTRAQADSLAYKIVAEAAAGRPVYRSAATTLGAELDDWLNAAYATARLGEYEVIAGPVQFDCTGVRDLPQTVVTAMSFYGGPIEILGRPAPGVVSGIGDLTTRKRMWVRAIDADKDAPKIWEVILHARAEGVENDEAVLVFPGADLSQLGDHAGKPRWNAEEHTLDQIVAKRGRK
jgi:hypothetical protein